MEQAALDALRRLDVDEARLQHQDLMERPRRGGDRQDAQLDAPLERIGGESLPASREAERMQQRSGEDRVRQRFGRRSNRAR